MHVDVTVSVPAAGKRLADGLVKLLQDIKDKKDVSVLVADALPLVIQSVKDLDELQADVKDSAMPILGGLLVGQIVSVLSGKSVEASAPTPVPTPEAAPAPMDPTPAA